MKKITGITFFFLLTGFFVLAQPMRTVPLDLVIETAQEREALGDYYNAIEWYDKAYKLEKNKDIAVRVANLYYQLRHYKSSENWLKRFLSRDEDNIYIEERYLYGKVLKSMGKFKESAEQFAQYLEFSTDEEKKKLVQVELKGMQSAKNYEDDFIFCCYSIKKTNRDGWL